MAKLTHGLLELEIRYQSWEDGWVIYAIGFTWDGKPILNDGVMKRHNALWNNRGTGEVHANEINLCCFIPLFEKLFETQGAVHVQTLDPDVMLAIWPKSAFPFMPSSWTLVYERPEMQAEREQRDQRRRDAGGMLPDDRVELMLFVDTYNFYESSYSDEGVCFRMQPTWDELLQFQADLKKEFIAFDKKHRILEEVELEYGDEEFLQWWRSWMRPA